MHFNHKIGRAFTIVLITWILALAPNAYGQNFRYFGTNLSDWAVISSPTGGGQMRWVILRNDVVPSGVFVDIPFGLTTDVVTNTGNWNATAGHDLSVYRGSTGTYYNSQINGAGLTVFNWGTGATDDAGSEGDYDGDQRMDYTIVRAPTPTSILQWWIFRSSDSTVSIFSFGNNATDIALAGADYTGDGTADPAVVRIGAGGQISWIWGNTAGVQQGQVAWGNFNIDFVVPGGDYDGDGRADFMVWRGLGDGVWYLLTSAGTTSYFAFGIPGTVNRDRALRAGDYDGDGRTDIAIYRPSTSTFWVNRSSGSIQTQTLGVPGNTNLPVAAYGIF